MRKEDFHKGQTVYLYDLHDRRKDITTEDRIKPAEVVTVGCSYISVKLYSTVYRFDIANCFRQASDYAPMYSLHLSKEAIFETIKDSKERDKIARSFNWNAYPRIVERLSEDDKQTILAIIQKYEK